MRTIVKLLIFSLIFSSTILQARIVSGVEIPEKLMINGSQLILNGAGVREKFFLDLYVGALYLKKRNKIAKAIIDAEENITQITHDNNPDRHIRLKVLAAIAAGQPDSAESMWVDLTRCSTGRRRCAPPTGRRSR